MSGIALDNSVINNILGHVRNKHQSQIDEARKMPLGFSENVYRAMFKDRVIEELNAIRPCYVPHTTHIRFGGIGLRLFAKQYPGEYDLEYKTLGFRELDGKKATDGWEAPREDIYIPILLKLQKPLPVPMISNKKLMFPDGYDTKRGGRRGRPDSSIELRMHGDDIVHFSETHFNFPVFTPKFDELKSKVLFKEFSLLLERLNELDKTLGQVLRAVIDLPKYHKGLVSATRGTPGLLELLPPRLVNEYDQHLFSVKSRKAEATRKKDNDKTMDMKAMRSVLATAGIKSKLGQ